VSTDSHLHFRPGRPDAGPGAANAVAEQVPIVLQDGKGQHARAAAQAFRALAEELWPTTSAAEAA